MTTYDAMNPTYVIYKYNRKTGEILDYDAYWTDLTEANLHPEIKPVFTKYYSAKEEYNMEDLSLNSWNKLLDDMAYGSYIYEKFYSNYKRGCVDGI